VLAKVGPWINTVEDNGHLAQETAVLPSDIRH
jgi:hypothetical protein